MDLNKKLVAGVLAVAAGIPIVSVLHDAWAKHSATEDKEKVMSMALGSFQNAMDIRGATQHLIRDREFCGDATRTLSHDTEFRKNLREEFVTKSRALLAIDPTYKSEIETERELVKSYLDIADRTHVNIVEACKMSDALGTFKP